MQFLVALGATTAVQKGPLWWAAHHRHHHKYSDQQLDVHSPKRGFWWSHVLWILCPKYEETLTELIPDFAKFPELRMLDRFHYVPPTLLATAVLFLGYYITGTWAGAWGVMFIGFFLSTVFVWHSTFTVNSLAHVFGRRRYATRDTSRNNVWPPRATSCAVYWCSRCCRGWKSSSARASTRWWARWCWWARAGCWSN
jgi:stearoyl-CoA desaturase (delta-9 desaturase)